MMRFVTCITEALSCALHVSCAYYVFTPLIEITGHKQLTEPTMSTKLLQLLHTWEEVYGFKLRTWFDRPIVAIFLVIIRVFDGSVTVLFAKNRRVTGAQSLSKQLRNLEPYKVCSIKNIMSWSTLSMTSSISHPILSSTDPRLNA